MKWNSSQTSAVLLASVVLWPVWPSVSAVVPGTASGGQVAAGDIVVSAVNQPPQLLANDLLILDQGSTAVLTANLLAAIDAESPASQITFTVAPDGRGGPPYNGELRLDGTALVAESTFTQEDINQGRLVYQHNDSNTTSDDFQFQVSDPDGGVIPGAPYFTYTFHIRITLVNHPPVAGHGSGTTFYEEPLEGVFPATDPDIPEQTLQYRIVTNGLKGTAVITDTNAGTFVYTPDAEMRGTDLITFQVSDGLLDSVVAGTFAITIKPHALSGTCHVLEGFAQDGMLAVSAATPTSALTFQILTNGSKGTVELTDAHTGAFTYSPTPGAAGPDVFAFGVNDGSLDSEPATVTLWIQPVVEPGDLFLTDKEGGALHYLDRKTLVLSRIAVGGALDDASACALDHAGNVLVAGSSGGLVQFSPADGTQTVISPGTNFSATYLGPFGIAEEASGTILVADGENGLVRVDPNTGAVTPLSQAGDLFLPLAVAIANNGDVFVADAASVADTNQPSRVVRINPVTGASTVISAGTNLDFPAALAVESPDSLVVSDGAGFFGRTNRLVRIDVATGAQSIVAEEGNLVIPAGIGLDDDGNILVASVGQKTVVQVDPGTGDQTVIAAADDSAMFLGLAVARRAILPDSDGDGLPDWCELKAGTDPADCQSVLKLELRSALAGGLLLEWGSVSNRFYTLERAAALTNAAAAFTPIKTGIEATPPRNAVTDPEADGGRNYFYRLRLEE